MKLIKIILYKLKFSSIKKYDANNVPMLTIYELKKRHMMETHIPMNFNFITMLLEHKHIKLLLC